VGWEEIGPGGSTFKIYLNPLVNWVWLGGLTLIAGTLLAAWPERQVVSAWVTTRRRLAIGVTIE
jgi:cytochrome c-type biogenesis protein CcmF